jgi:quercetin dioxygenase-like cupin family protein
MTKKPTASLSDEVEVEADIPRTPKKVQKVTPKPAPPSPPKEPAVRAIEIAFEDDNGEIANILDVAIGHVAVIRSVAGAVRGNHYHKQDEQWIYVASGRMVVRAIDPVTERQWNYYVEEGELEYMPPGIAHAYYFPKETLFLNMTPRPRDPKLEGQTVPWEVWDGPARGSM